MRHGLSRRRVIGIAAAAAGLDLLPRAAWADTRLVSWRGSALGATATLRIHHRTRDAALRLIERALAEIKRLEGIFSLYREDSALSALNRTGLLVAPPPELVDLLAECRRYGSATAGAFDPTVQPLWNLYRGHFSRPDADPAGPSQEAIEAALSKVGMAHVLVGRDRIAFMRRGMGLTLNGIAQGYATDRIVTLLRSEGIAHSLVDLGEGRALGTRPDGAPWRVGISDPDDPDTVGATLDLVDCAVATSGVYGFRFAGGDRFNHLFDPRTGACAARFRAVTVTAPTATEADALSTAFSIMPTAAILRTMKALGHGEAYVTTREGGRHVIRGSSGADAHQPSVPIRAGLTFGAGCVGCARASDPTVG